MIAAGILAGLVVAYLAGYARGRRAGAAYFRELEAERMVRTGAT